MDLPDLVTQQLGGETIESAVNLGDEDLICFTPTRTLLYRGEGLIGDESIEVYDSDVERLDVTTGRRKTAFRLEYVGSEERFSVSRDRSDAVLQRLLGSILAAAGVLDEEESVRDVYLFSELTIVITDLRLVKHVGAYVWDEDYEEYPFEEVTGIDFEEGSVATGIVLSVAGRRQRFKAPSDEAELLRRSLTNALCEFYDVGSPAQLDSVLAEKDDQTEDDTTSQELEFDDSISPLVSESDDEPTGSFDADAIQGLGEGGTDAGMTATGEPDSETTQAESTAEATTESGRSPGGGGQAEPAIDPEEIDAMQTQLSKLTTAVKRQNELLKQQHETMHKLVEELQRREG